LKLGTVVVLSTVSTVQAYQFPVQKVMVQGWGWALGYSGLGLELGMGLAMGMGWG